MTIDPKSIAIGALGALLLAAYQAAPAVTATAAAPAAAAATGSTLPTPRVIIEGIPTPDQFWYQHVSNAVPVNFTVPDGQALIVTGVGGAGYSSGQPSDYIRCSMATDDGPGTPFRGITAVSFAAGQTNGGPTHNTSTYTFPTPVRIDPGSTFNVTVPNNSHGPVVVTGYLVSYP